MGVTFSLLSATTQKYDVFISFRGSDVRESFLSHLYRELRAQGIKTFEDNGLNRGEEIEPSILGVIKRSRISVIIFSKNFAFSKWCLEELVKIMECRRRYGQKVIPVFYNLDPTVVECQTDSFQDAFERHEQGSDADKVQRWRNDLREAAYISGWDSGVTRPEAKLVEEIVKDIMGKLGRRSSGRHDGNGHRESDAEAERPQRRSPYGPGIFEGSQFGEIFGMAIEAHKNVVKQRLSDQIAFGEQTQEDNMQRFRNLSAATYSNFAF